MSNSLYFVPRQEIDPQVWDSFVEANEEAWLWHRYAFVDTLLTWPDRRDQSFAVLDKASGGKMVAVLPLYVIDLRIKGVFRVRTLESFGGPAFTAGLGTRHRRAILDQFLAHLLRIADRLNAGEISFTLSPLAPRWRGKKCPRTNPLLMLGCENTLTQTWIVDLRRDLDALWNGLEGRARTTIRKAINSGVKVRQASRETDLDIYYDLHRETYLRTGARPHPKTYFAAIWNHFVNHGIAQFFFAELGGSVVAAENFSIYKSAVCYWTGAASEKGLKVGANSLLQWTAMQWMVERGLSWYEVGEAFPNIKDGKLKGLNDFKKSFGGNLYPFYKGRLPVNNRAAKILKVLRMGAALIQ